MSDEGAAEEVELEPEEIERILYTARVNAWFTTRLELDKTLLAFSTAGIGLWRFLLDPVRDAPWWGRCAHGLMVLGFLATILCVVRVLGLNSHVIVEAIQSKETAVDEGAEKKAAWWDRAAAMCFVPALIFFVVTAVAIEVDWVPEVSSMAQSESGPKGKSKGGNKEGSYVGSGDLKPKPKPKPTKSSSDGGKGKSK